MKFFLISGLHPISSELQRPEFQDHEKTSRNFFMRDRTASSPLVPKDGASQKLNLHEIAARFGQEFCLEASLQPGSKYERR